MAQKQYLRTYILIHKYEAKEVNWEWCGLLETSKPSCRDIISPQTIFPNPSQTVPPIGDEAFQYMSLRKTFLLKLPQP